MEKLMGDAFTAAMCIFFLGALYGLYQLRLEGDFNCRIDSCCSQLLPVIFFGFFAMICVPWVEVRSFSTWLFYRSLDHHFFDFFAALTLLSLGVFATYLLDIFAEIFVRVTKPKKKRRANRA